MKICGKSSIQSVFLKSLHHGHDILRRHIRLNVVYLSKNKTTAGCEVFHPPFDFIFDLFFAPVQKYLLCIAPSPPECDVLAKFPIQSRRIHLGSRYLNRIQSIYTGFNKPWNESVYGSARMKQTKFRIKHKENRNDKCISNIQGL